MNKKLKLWELNRVSEEEFKKQEKFPIIVVLDNIRSLSNVGSFFRTSDAFNIEELVLCGITAQPPHREIQKTAIGATESVSWSHHENTIEVVKSYKERGYAICCIEQTENTMSLEDVNQIDSKNVDLIKIII